MSNWNQIINELTHGRNLDFEESKWVMNQIMAGDASNGRLGAVLALMAAKGETKDEIAGFAESMIKHAKPFKSKGRYLDIVGTGGDHALTVNISTMAAVVIAASGIHVLKHGNRASSSLSGSADVLAELGLNLNLTPEEVAEVVEEVGISFAFAQVFHPAMKHAAPVRKEIEIHTIFNLLGPLTNPSHPETVVIGVANAKYAHLVAEVFAFRGQEGFVFNAQDENGNGMDELAATAHGTLYEIRQMHGEGVIKETTFDPANFYSSIELEPIEIADLRGGTPSHNAKVINEVFAGIGSDSDDSKEERAIFQTVCLNAAAGIVADETLLPYHIRTPKQPFDMLNERFIYAYNLAREVIISGQAEEKLSQWIEATNNKGNK